MVGPFMGLFYRIGCRDMLLYLLPMDLFGTDSAWKGFGFGKNGAYLGAAILAFNQANKNRHSAFMAYFRYRRHKDDLIRDLPKRGLVLRLLGLVTQVNYLVQA